MKMSGAQAIVQCLLEQGVTTVFGYPGGSILPLYDALYHGPIHHVLTVHEQGAVHAADGYARSSGKAGVCMATSGPGATNLITGLATAHLDSVPLIAITGQVATSFIGRDSFQETDMVSLTLAITKHNFLVSDPKKLVATIRQAFSIALSGRPGPVLIDIPVDIQTMEVDWEPISSLPVEGRANEARRDLDKVQAQVKEAVQAIQGAKRPVILVGGGVIRGNASAEVAILAETCQAPVVSTLMGIGAFTASHPQYLGMTGLHGHRIANHSIQEADVIIAIGCRFSERLTGKRSGYSLDKVVIHLDIDQTELEKNVGISVGLAGDIRQLLTMLVSELSILVYPTWWQQLEAWREPIREWTDDFISVPRIMDHLNQVRQEKATIYVTDVGQNQMWAAQNLKVEMPRGWITSGGFGTMGFGLPAAIGTAFARPEADIIHLAGDAGFKMTGIEWYTAIREKKRLISIIFDNHCLGMVRQLQELFYQERYSETLLGEFDFQQFVGACGVAAVVVRRHSEFVAAYKAAEASLQGMVIIVKVPTKNLVSPMMKPGGKIGEYVVTSS